MDNVRSRLTRKGEGTCDYVIIVTCHNYGLTLRMLTLVAYACFSMHSIPMLSLVHHSAGYHAGLMIMSGHRKFPVNIAICPCQSALSGQHVQSKAVYRLCKVH